MSAKVLARCSLVTAVVVLVAALWPAPSRAYRTSADDPGIGIGAARWRSQRLPMSMSGAPPAGLSPVESERALLEAWGIWELAGCAVPRSEYRGFSGGSPAASSDGVVTAQFISQAAWDLRAFGSETPATTVVTYVSGESGPEIVDADIFLNAESSLWETDHSAAQEAMLALLVHELGHVLGLLHSCELDADGPLRCVGDPVDASPTMHPLFFPGAATLAPDDTAGACFLYLVACEPDCGAGFACDAGTCVASCAATNCEPGAACIPGVGCAPTAAPACAESCRDTNDCLEAGDPCATSCACGTELCADGVCARPCSEPDDCDALDTCSAGACEAYLGTYGDACTRGSHCVSEVCLLRTDASGGPSRGSCTRPCVPGRTCPAGSVCSEIDAQFVCAEIAAPASGCAIGDARRRRGASASWGGGWLVLLLAGWRMRIRRAR